MVVLDGMRFILLKKTLKTVLIMFFDHFVNPEKRTFLALFARWFPIDSACYTKKW